jgi:zinc transport system ATP-binding protein
MRLDGGGTGNGVPGEPVVANVLEVERLSVRFGKRPLFPELSFNVAEGSSLAIIGPNGAGKTVLLRALVGTMPHEGTVRWAPGVRVGYVPQKLDIERDLPLSGADLLRARARLVGATSSDIDDALRHVGLGADAMTALIGTLSGGQFQRLLLAFALLGKPTVLLLDELTAGVDEPGQELLTEMVSRLQRGRGVTVVSISHDLTIVQRYADNVLCLSRAHTCFGAPRTVLTAETLSQVYGAPVGLHVHDGSIT